MIVDGSIDTLKMAVHLESAGLNLAPLVSFSREQLQSPQIPNYVYVTAGATGQSLFRDWCAFTSEGPCTQVAHMSLHSNHESYNLRNLPEIFQSKWTEPSSLPRGGAGISPCHPDEIALNKNTKSNLQMVKLPTASTVENKSPVSSFLCCCSS
ncbi:hypothetical protein STEG23_019660 [Scotinomys teguina]